MEHLQLNESQSKSQCVLVISNCSLFNMNVFCLVLLVRIHGRHPKLMDFLNNHCCAQSKLFSFFSQPFSQFLYVYVTQFRVVCCGKWREMFEMGAFKIVKGFFFWRGGVGCVGYWMVEEKWQLCMYSISSTFPSTTPPPLPLPHIATQFVSGWLIL